jgi:hypothetical protein
MKDCEAIMTFTSETLPVDHKAAIRQMKQELRQQMGRESRIQSTPRAD